MKYKTKKEPVGEIDQPAKLGTEEKKSNVEIILYPALICKNTNPLLQNFIERLRENYE